MVDVIRSKWLWSRRKYRRYIEKKLRPLIDVYSKAVIGDFSHNVEIPKKEDEFTEIYVGTQLMLEVIREKLTKLEDLSAGLEEKVEKKTAELERLNNALVGRELKMVKLKKELAKRNSVKDGKS